MKAKNVANTTVIKTSTV